MNPLNTYFDHTLLRPEATQEEVEKACKEALEYQFAALCVQPTWAKKAYELLEKSDVKLCIPVGFPLGANTTEIKVAETSQAVEDGAREIDMVMNIGALKSKDYKKVEQDIKAVVKAASPWIVKVILETCLLNEEEKRLACQLVKESGAQFVKTSTGYSRAGATTYDVFLLRKVVGPEFGVKASGGIKDLQTALSMIKSGASRIGSSSSVAIMQEWEKRSHGSEA